MSVSRLPQEEELRFSAPAPEIEGYKIIEKLGEAGQGQVWRAVQSSTGRQVALKVPRIGLLSSKKTLARFEREVEIAAQLKHPHIARIIDSGVHRGLYYYTMDLIEGVHLDQYVKDNALSQRQILELMKVICEAVQHAHQNGVIHRDLKPSNIIVTREGYPYIVDFGLAKSVGGHEPAVTVSLDGEAAGTPAYMSPEQAAGHVDRIDTRTDVYSLGAILFMLLTGEHPHDLSGSHYDVLHRISQQEVTQPQKLNPNIDRDLEALLLKALENDPDRRYSSAAGLAEDIDRYLNRLPLSAMPRSRIRRMNSFVRRHRIGVAIGVTVSLLGLAAVVTLAAGTILISQEKQRTKKALEREQQALSQETQARKDVVQQRDLAYQNLYVAQIRLAPQYWEVGQIFRLKELLDSYIPEPNETDLRGWEWYYLLSLCHQDLMTLHGHATGVTSAAWSPDGRLVASACKKGIVKLWDTTTGQEYQTLRGHAGGVSKVTWSPDGKQLASAGRDGTARIWEIATGREVLRFSGHIGGVNAIAWSPDRDAVATGSDDNTVRFWNSETGEENFVFKAHTAPVQCLAWRLDGQYVASGDAHGWLRIWDARTGREIQALRPLDHDLWSVAWSPDGNYVASTGFGHPLIIWNAATGQRSRSIPLTGAGESVAWSPDGGLLAVATMSQLVQIWNAETGQRVATFKGHMGPVNSVAFSPDGKRLLSGGDDEMVKIWDVNEPRSAVVLRHPKAAAVAWNPKGDILASAGGGVMKLWDLHTWRECARWNTPQFYMSEDAPEVSIAWSPEGSRIVAGRWGPPGEEIRVWDSNTGMEVLRLSKGSNPAWSPDGEHLAISVGTVVEVWDLSSNSVAYRLTGHGGSVYSISWSPGGDRLATGEWGLIRIWDGESGELLQTLSGHQNWIGTITWSPDGGRLASGGWGQEIRIWDAHLGKQIATMTGHSGAITSVQWSPTGERIASGASDNLAKVWDVAAGREVLNLQGYADTVRSVSWSPDGRRLATASQDGTVRIWDASFGYDVAKSTVGINERTPR
jgi:WD40 repeat protein/serine/threonine protein kinase